MLTALGATALGLASPGVGAAPAPPAPSLADYALVTTGVVLNASTAIRITEPS